MPKQAFTLIVGVLAISLLLIGCGSEDNSDTTTNPDSGSASDTQAAPQKQEFNARADEKPARDETTATPPAADESPEASSPKAPSSQASSPNDRAEPESISKAAFVKQANAICGEHTRELVAKVQSQLQARTNNPAQSANTDLVLKLIVPSLQQELAEIRALPVPSGDQAQVDALLAGLEELVQDLEQDPAAFSNNAAPYAKAEKPAQRYGLSSCPLG